jgi:hypothetical protein
MRHHYTDPNGVTHTWETPDTPTPLDRVGVLATLNAILHPDHIEDYAHAVGLTSQDLINEALAWGVAQSATVDHDK